MIINFIIFISLIKLSFDDIKKRYIKLSHLFLFLLFSIICNLNIEKTMESLSILGILYLTDFIFSYMSKKNRIDDLFFGDGDKLLIFSLSFFLNIEESLLLIVLTYFFQLLVSSFFNKKEEIIPMFPTITVIFYLIIIKGLFL